MKRLSMILLTLLLAFGFTSAAMANGDAPAPASNEKIYKDRGVTTIVKTNVEERPGESIVKQKRFKEYFTTPKSASEKFYRTFYDVKKEKHPRRDLYRKITFERTFEFNKVKTWDEVTRVDKIATFTTPVTIVKTTVTTIKFKGKNLRHGKIISKDVQVTEDNRYGETVKTVAEEKRETFNKNYKENVTKKLIKERRYVGKWMRYHHHSKR
ncbi:hypothetical protein [Planococcus sp. CAU13]|uniref:hypothetical protein n=1 Tax=Planococcus sp. CAU13 TaxID=1541197 RepID=UPI00052FF380|nr:hypothetical protein [Planococcus sp. CAU13]